MSTVTVVAGGLAAGKELLVTHEVFNGDNTEYVLTGTDSSGDITLNDGDTIRSAVRNTPTNTTYPGASPGA